MTMREPCRAARRGRGAGAAFALHRGDSGAPGTRQGEGVNAFGRCRNKLSPLSPRKNGLSPAPVGTDFFNRDKGLRGFFRFVPTVPTKLKRPPEADPAKTHAQTPRRPAAPALVGMVRAVIRGAGVPPERVLLGCFGIRVIRTPSPRQLVTFSVGKFFWSIRAVTVHFSR